MSFSTSLSGLSANQQKLDVIGNNLANINTIAFKEGDVNFSDLVSQSVGGSSVNPMQIGLGVTTGSISPNFRQGGIENTGVPTNVAIQGSGFFVIGAAGNRSYTRAGDFSQDANGTLITRRASRCRASPRSIQRPARSSPPASRTNIVVPPGVLRAPKATTQFGAASNLDANAAVGATFTVSPQIFDSLGTAHVVTVTYTQDRGRMELLGACRVRMSSDHLPRRGAQAGTLTFTAAGLLTLVGRAAAADVAVPSGCRWKDGAAATAMTWDLIDANGVASLTGFSAPSQTSSLTQNGAAAGSVSGISIDSDGQIVATIGAGQTVVLGQLALANFNNPAGLMKLGSNAYGESAAAGIANVGVAGTGGRGSLIGSSLEQSNVDMAKEFTQMILAQRGYQANSKSITTADQLLQETLQLKQ